MKIAQKIKKIDRTCKYIKFYGRGSKKCGSVGKSIGLANVERPKKHAAELRASVDATGGGRPLTDTEEKILTIMGPNSAYGESGETEGGYVTVSDIKFIIYEIKLKIRSRERLLRYFKNHWKKTKLLQQFKLLVDATR